MHKLNVAVALALVVAVLFGGYFFVTKKNGVYDIPSGESVVSQREDQEMIEKVVDDSESLVWYEIPELNVRFRVEKRIADELQYRYQPGETYENALFYSDELVRIPGCDAQSGSLGAFTKLKGSPADYEAKDYLESGNPKQFNGFFVVFNGPQASCAGKGYENEWVRYFERNPEMNGWSSGVLERLEIIDGK